MEKAFVSSATGAEGYWAVIDDRGREIYTDKDEWVVQDKLDELISEECTEPVPAEIHIYHARFTGSPVAECTECNRKWHYWECACDFEHDCEVAE